MMKKWRKRLDQKRRRNLEEAMERKACQRVALMLILCETIPIEIMWKMNCDETSAQRIARGVALTSTMCEPLITELPLIVMRGAHPPNFVKDPFTSLDGLLTDSIILMTMTMTMKVVSTMRVMTIVLMVKGIKHHLKSIPGTDKSRYPRISAVGRF